MSDTSGLRYDDKEMAAIFRAAAEGPQPASSIVPLRSRIEPRRSVPREMVRRLPAAFQEPSNSSHSPGVPGGLADSVAGLHAVTAKAKIRRA